MTDKEILEQARFQRCIETSDKMDVTIKEMFDLLTVGVSKQVLLNYWNKRTEEFPLLQDMFKEA